MKLVERLERKMLAFRWCPTSAGSNSDTFWSTFSESIILAPDVSGILFFRSINIGTVSAVRLPEIFRPNLWPRWKYIHQFRVSERHTVGCRFWFVIVVKLIIFSTEWLTQSSPSWWRLFFSFFFLRTAAKSKRARSRGRNDDGNNISTRYILSTPRPFFGTLSSIVSIFRSLLIVHLHGYERGVVRYKPPPFSIVSERTQPPSHSSNFGFRGWRQGQAAPQSGPDSSLIKR